jgi:CRP-like cAMP-binding protein
MTGISESSVSNLFLATIALADLAAMTPYLEPVSLPARHILQDKDQPVEHIYFPGRGMISLVMPLEDGALIETGLVGREGAIGLSALTGHKPSLHSAMVQMQGDAMRIRASVMRELSLRHPGLMTQVLLSSQALYAQVSYAAVCNVRHNLLERLARWLLMAHDRAENEVLPLTQEFMAMMLGARRPGVTVAANMLQHSGAITYGRGRVSICDRRRLEDSACECYAAQRGVYRRLLNWPVDTTETTHAAVR